MGSNAQIDIESILKVVKTYAEEFGLTNSFTAYLDKDGKEHSGDYKATFEIDNSVIAVNQKQIDMKRPVEYISALLAYFQLPAYMIEEAKAYENGKNADLMLDTANMEHLIKESMMLGGICKTVEVEILNRMAESKAYEFSDVMTRLVKSIIISEEEMSGFGEDDWDDVLSDTEMTKSQFIEFNRGYRILKKLHEDATELGPEYERRILKGAVVVASESENFDTTFGRLPTDYTVRDILVQSRFLGVVVPESLENVKEMIRNGRAVMGGKENVTTGDIRPNITELHDYIDNGGFSRKVVEVSKGILDRLGDMKEEAVIDIKTKGKIRELYNSLETFDNMFKGAKEIWLK